jgi:hypothetical protein
VWSAGWLNVVVHGLAAIGAPLLLWGVVRLALWGRRKLHVPWWAVMITGLVLYGVCISVAAQQSHEAYVEVLSWPLWMLMGLYFISLFCAPAWALGVYLGMSLRLAWRYPRAPRYRLIQLMAVVTWLGAFFAACRWAVERSLAEYAKLPVSNPGGCYVASAAARGHPWLVGSWSVLTADGEGRAGVGQLPIREERRFLRRYAGGPSTSAHHRRPWPPRCHRLHALPAGGGLTARVRGRR